MNPVLDELTAIPFLHVKPSVLSHCLFSKHQLEGARGADSGRPNEIELVDPSLFLISLQSKDFSGNCLREFIGSAILVGQRRLAALACRKWFSSLSAPTGAATYQPRAERSGVSRAAPPWVRDPVTR